MDNNGDLPKILIVDDDNLDFAIFKKALKKVNISSEILRGSDGLDGLNILRESDPKSKYIVLLDLRMPKMSGLEFLSELRADPQIQNTVIFVLSTSRDESEKDLAYDPGISGFLTKGKDPGKVLEHANMIKEYANCVNLPFGQPHLVS